MEYIHQHLWGGSIETDKGKMESIDRGIVEKGNKITTFVEDYSLQS
jgi:hypothetical protein